METISKKLKTYLVEKRGLNPKDARKMIENHLEAVVRIYGDDLSNRKYSEILQAFESSDDKYELRS